MGTLASEDCAQTSGHDEPGVQEVTSDDGYETLEQYLKNNSLTEQQAFNFVIYIAEGLASLHRRNIVHKDLHPKNIFLGQYGKAVITDSCKSQSVGDSIDPCEFQMGGPGDYAPAPELREGKCVSEIDTFYFLQICLEVFEKFCDFPRYQHDMIRWTHKQLVRFQTFEVPKRIHRLADSFTLSVVVQHRLEYLMRELSRLSKRKEWGMERILAELRWLRTQL